MNQELVGKKMGKITVLEAIDGRGGNTIYKCLCECGNEVRLHQRRFYIPQGKQCKDCFGKYLEDRLRMRDRRK